MQLVKTNLQTNMRIQDVYNVYFYQICFARKIVYSTYLVVF